MRRKAKQALSTVAWRRPVLRMLLRLGDRWTLASAGGARVVARRVDDRFLILVFHRISVEPNPLAIDVTPAPLFDDMMRFVARNYDPISLDEIVRRLDAGRRLPRRALAITFDDGYADNSRVAYHVLRGHGLPATFFVTTGPIGGGPALWYQRVLRGFAVSPLRSVRIPVLGTDASLDGPEARGRAGIACLIAVRRLPERDRDAAIDELFARLDVAPDIEVPDEMMTWDDLRELDRGGMTIGAHTVRHPILTTVDLDRARWEIVESKRILERELGHVVRLFAYPNGRTEDYSEEIVGAVREAGFVAAVTTNRGPNDPRSSRFELRRIHTGATGLPAFASALTRYHLEDSHE